MSLSQATSMPAEYPRDRLSTLPTPLLLRVLATLELPDLVFGVKPASRTLYLHATSLARERALPLWLEQVRQARRSGAPPSATRVSVHVTRPSTVHDETVDALPSYAAVPQAPEPPLAGRLSRELAVFDLFVATLARSLARLSASTLLLTGEDDALRIPGDARQDLFGHLQPKAFCEDCLIAEGRRSGWIVEAPDERGGSSSDLRLTVATSRGASRAASAGRFATVREDDVRVDLKLREARLLLLVHTTSDARSGNAATWKGVATVSRRPEDGIESVARRLAREAGQAGVVRIENGTGGRWYEW